MFFFTFLRSSVYFFYFLEFCWNFFRKKFFQRTFLEILTQCFCKFSFFFSKLFQQKIYIYICMALYYTYTICYFYITFLWLFYQNKLIKEIILTFFLFWQFLEAEYSRGQTSKICTPQICTPQLCTLRFVHPRFVVQILYKPLC